MSDSERNTPGETAAAFDFADRQLDGFVALAKLGPITSPALGSMVVKYLEDDAARDYAPQPCPQQTGEPYEQMMVGALAALLATALQRLAAT